MTADRREDALDWGDPDDPSWVDPGRDEPSDDVPADEVAADEPLAPGDEGADARDGVAAPVATAASAADRRRTAVTAATGLLAGVYLAYSVGWILSIGALPLTGATLLIEVMYQFGEFLAIIACALWFGTVMALTRGGRPAVRIGWLALGTLVLVPWPLLIGVLS
ncbi:MULTISPECIES: hypothetical protein [unclassified Microcella]|uniref:hypothetical protein n=1 Tax=unclassified Microcella TaxID=2630066 RepID=UPI0006F82616|nr:MULTISPECIES: hypothetical protein [unclassified Microcella]KQV24493.1 hypothetical protein ASC54_08070 [Yonghaparkia sp. Root332]KRF30786.1 hypothetical protein ASG83_07905 [Yonghaparkia sp. Soil809]